MARQIFSGQRHIDMRDAVFEQRSSTALTIEERLPAQRLRRNPLVPSGLVLAGTGWSRPPSWGCLRGAASHNHEGAGNRLAV